MPQLVSWLPVDVAAAAMVDLLDSKEDLVHLIHPRPVPWMQIFQPMSDMLKVPLVPYAEWFKRLEESRVDSTDSEIELMKKIPALKILETFRNGALARALRDTGASTGEERRRIPILSVSRALKASSTLANPELQPLGAEDVEKWLSYWKLM